MTDIDPRTLSHAVRRALADGRLRRSVRALNEAIDRLAARRGTECRACGRCCRFDDYGHLLYTTTLELAVFAAETMSGGPAGRDRPHAAARMAMLTAEFRGECPFLADGRCAVHAVRPAGCRLFFCGGGEWQQDLYRDCHRRIRALHERFGMPYAYFEWLTGLAALAGVQKSGLLV